MLVRIWLKQKILENLNKKLGGILVLSFLININLSINDKSSCQLFFFKLIDLKYFKGFMVKVCIVQLFYGMLKGIGVWKLVMTGLIKLFKFYFNFFLKLNYLCLLVWHALQQLVSKINFFLFFKWLILTY